MQGDKHLAPLADFEPELGVSAVAGAVPAAPRSEPPGPPARQLTAVAQDAACGRKEVRHQCCSMHPRGALEIELIR